MNYSRTIREYCLQNKGMVFDVSYEMGRHFAMIPYRTMCKILSRLEEEGIIRKFSKGIYIVNSDKGGEDPIIAFYANENTGTTIGYRMYNDLGITEREEKPIVILTNAMETASKNIGEDYRLEKMDVFFDDGVKKLITCLELIENQGRITGLNLFRLNEMLIDYLQYYGDLFLREILAKRRYKYSTIATLDRLLSDLHIPNDALKIAEGLHADR